MVNQNNRKAAMLLQLSHTPSRAAAIKQQVFWINESSSFEWQIINMKKKPEVLAQNQTIPTAHPTQD